MGSACDERQTLNVSVDTKWAFYLDPEDFSTNIIAQEVPVGAIMIKGNQTIVTHSDYGTELHEHPDARFFVVEEEELIERESTEIEEYLKPLLVKYMIANNVLPQNSKLTGVSKGINIRVSATAERFWIGFKVILGDDNLPGNASVFALGLDKTENYTSWSIERDPSGRASCKKCGRRISKGTLRFVRDDMFYGRSSRGSTKRHPGCMGKRNFGYIDPRTIAKFHELDEVTKNRLYRELLGWRSHFVISQADYMSMNQRERLASQNNVLGRLDLGVGILDYDILDAIKSVYQESDFPKFREDVANIVYQVLKQQIGDSGLTLFLDTDKMKERPELIPLIPDILDLRKKEMADCIVSKQDDAYDLRPLWVTHWGFKLLSATHRRLTASEKTISKVKNLLSSAGFEMKIQDRKETKIHVKMSNNMRDYIWSNGQFNTAILSKFELVLP